MLKHTSAHEMLKNAWNEIQLHSKALYLYLHPYALKPPLKVLAHLLTWSYKVQVKPWLVKVKSLDFDYTLDPGEASLRALSSERWA